MKITKQERKRIRFMINMNEGAYGEDQVRTLQDAFDDLDELEKRAAWAEVAHSALREIVAAHDGSMQDAEVCCYLARLASNALADLAKGPSEGNGGGG